MGLEYLVEYDFARLAVVVRFADRSGRRVKTIDVRFDDYSAERAASPADFIDSLCAVAVERLCSKD